MKYKGLLALKIYVMIAVVVAWNVGFIVAMNMEPVPGDRMMPRESAVIISVTCLLASVFAISVAMSKNVQAAVLAPKRIRMFSPRPYYFISFVTGVLALSSYTF